MTGSGSGVYGNIEINNSGHGVNMTDNSTINGQIKFTNGYLYIDDYALTLGTGVNHCGYNQCIKTDFAEWRVERQGREEDLFNRGLIVHFPHRSKWEIYTSFLRVQFKRQ